MGNDQQCGRTPQNASKCALQIRRIQRGEALVQNQQVCILQQRPGDEDAAAFKGWAKVAWSKPEGAELDAIDDRLKALKLTIRNAPLDQGKVEGTCLFTGAPAKEWVLIARAY